MERERRARSIKKDHRVYSSIFVILGPFFPPFPLSLYFLPLLYSSCGDFSPSSSFLFLLSLSLSARAVAFSAAGPHPHTQCGCYPVLYSPVHCNSATMNTTLLVHTYNAPLQWVECANQEEGGPIGMIYSVGRLIPHFQQHRVVEGGREMQRWKAVYKELNLGRWIYIVKISIKYLIAWNAYLVNCRWCC